MWAMVAGWLAWGRGDDGEGRLKGVWWLGVATGLKWVTAPLLVWAAWSRVRAKDWAAAGWLMAVGVAPVALGLAWFHFDFERVGPLAPENYVAWARTGELGPWLLELAWPESASRNGMVLAVFVPVAAGIFFRTKTMTGFAETFLFALLVASPSVHAWYFVWLVPLAVATRNRGTMLVSVSAFVYFWLWET